MTMEFYFSVYNEKQPFYLCIQMFLKAVLMVLLYLPFSDIKVKQFSIFCICVGF